MQKWGIEIQKNYKNLLVVGIGGSSLGGRMLLDSLTNPYENLSAQKKLRIFFTGDNLDPFDLHSLLEALNPQETAVLVISKSGGTVEPLACLMVLFQWLGNSRKKQITLFTDPFGGVLYDFGKTHHLSIFPQDNAVGGRWSVLSAVGLMVAAAAEIDIEGLLQGARSMDKAMEESSWKKNPALLYAGLMHKGHMFGYNECVFMPYSKRLFSMSLWYIQLLAESLGKALSRDGLKIHTGRTPIPALGTTDMHAQTQQHQEGPRNKVLTFIEVRDHGKNIFLPAIPDFSPP
jgi:glucose-6-phosphate isomerase